MGMRLKTKGLDDLITALHQLDADTEGIIKAAMYDGAGMILDAVKAEIEKLPEDNGYKRPGDLRDVVTADEKKDLLEHIGIARYTKKGSAVHTAIGFNGYSSHKTKKYPNGVPIPLIARSIESGSTVRKKRPFMRTAVKSVQEQVTQKMQERLAAEITKKMEG